MPCYTLSIVWRRAVELLGTVVMPDEWSTVLVLHCSPTIAACLYALQALIVLPARTSCRRMMALMLNTLETFACALGTCVPNCTGRLARLFFMLEYHDLQGAT
jgi:hypothetical protein